MTGSRFPRRFRRSVHRRGRSLAAALVIALLLPVAAAANPTRPVIIVLLDSLRADHLQAYGYGRATSPNILAFSKGATVFETTYAAASWTPPSIMSLLTGQYSSELTTNPGGGAPLTDGHPTLGTVFRAWGYTTALIYNTAQLAPAASNLQGGFDRYIDYGDKDFVLGHTDRGVDTTIDFLRSAKKPAFVFLHILDPHHPYLPSHDYFGNVPTNKYRNSMSYATPSPQYDPNKVEQCYLVKDWSTVPEMAQLYDSEIRDADAQIGRLLQFIDNDARYRDAVVVITGDHGEEFGEHGGLYHGARFYDESLRVPLIIRDRTRPYSVGRRVPYVASLVDVAPTMLSLAGIPFERTQYSGQTLLPYFTRRGGLPRDTAFIEKPGCSFDPIVAVRKGKWKMILRLTRTHVEMYDLASDPGEKHDLASSKLPEVRRAHADLYNAFETWYHYVNRPLATRSGDKTPPLPADLRERLKALGYLQ